MSLEWEEELKRKPVDLNLSAARLAKSPQTGFIHLCYQSTDTRHDTIPTLENFCYVLALLRSRLVDAILDAKILLEKLLAFEVDGNFPLYLHEYPLVKKRSHGINLIPVVHWILHDFHSIFSQELKLHLKAVLERLVSCAMQMHAAKPLSPLSLLKLKSYSEPEDLQLPSPKSSEEWGEVLIAYQLAESRGVNRTDLLEKAFLAWNQDLLTPLCFHHQAKGEPLPTLFDLFMGHYFKKYSKRSLSPQRIHLLAALIQPFSHTFSPELTSSSSNSLPFTLYWGTEEMLHSLTLDHKKSEITCDTDKQLVLTLPLQIPPEGEEAIESSFYLNLHPDHSLRVNSDKATTFQLKDRIHILSQGKTFTLSVDVVEGEGRFFGHLLRANRPHQKHAMQFETFDWQIALRTITRSERCVLRWTVCVN